MFTDQVLADDNLFSEVCVQFLSFMFKTTKHTIKGLGKGVKRDSKDAIVLTNKQPTNLIDQTNLHVE